MAVECAQAKAIARAWVPWVLLAVVTSCPACAPAATAQCQSVYVPATIVTVTDATTGQPVCGANVAAWRIFDDAAVGRISLGGDEGDSGCTGQYSGALQGTGTWTVHVQNAGYETATTAVQAPSPVDCSSSAPNRPQQVSISLSRSPDAG
jgi:hypothetical protein